MFYAIFYKSYTMPFACCVLSHFHTYVLPQALAIITPYIAPFRAAPFAASGRLSLCVLVRPGGVHLYALHRGNVAAGVDVGGIYTRRPGVL